MEVELGKANTCYWDIIRIPKLVVVLVGIVISCALIYYLASISNNYYSGNFLPTFTSNHILAHNEHKELKKVLKAASTKEKTVILTTLNEAWAKPNSIFDLFLESFKLGNHTARLLPHLVVIAIDKKAFSWCRSTVSHCYFFKTNMSTKMASEAMFMSPIYLDMMWKRLAFLHIVLSLGFNFVFTDTDVMWLRDPFPHFYPKADFQTSCDFYNGKPFDLRNFPNNGFNFVRSNDKTIKFYQYWVSLRGKYPDLNEQEVFNKIKHRSIIKQIGLKIRFLDTNYFGGFCKPSKDFNKVCTMHANCCVGLDNKIVDIRTTLEDWKRFVSLSSNVTRLRSRRFRWRVPNKCHM